MELITEKGHPFAEELEKVSNVVSPLAGIVLALWPGGHNWICHLSDHHFLSVSPGTSHSSVSLSFSICTVRT